MFKQGNSEAFCENTCTNASRNIKAPYGSCAKIQSKSLIKSQSKTLEPSDYTRNPTSFYIAMKKSISSNQWAPHCICHSFCYERVNSKWDIRKSKCRLPYTKQATKLVSQKQTIVIKLESIAVCYKIVLKVQSTGC